MVDNASDKIYLRFSSYVELKRVDQAIFLFLREAKGLNGTSSFAHCQTSPIHSSNSDKTNVF